MFRERLFNLDQYHIYKYIIHILYIYTYYIYIYIYTYNIYIHIIYIYIYQSISVYISLYQFILVCISRTYGINSCCDFSVHQGPQNAIATAASAVRTSAAARRQRRRREAKWLLHLGPAQVKLGAVGFSNTIWMICHDLSWFVMIYYDLSWLFIMIYHDWSIFGDGIAFLAIKGGL